MRIRRCIKLERRPSFIEHLITRGVHMELDTRAGETLRALNMKATRACPRPR